MKCLAYILRNRAEKKVHFIKKYKILLHYKKHKCTFLQSCLIKNIDIDTHYNCFDFCHMFSKFFIYLDTIVKIYNLACDMNIASRNAKILVAEMLN